MPKTLPKSSQAPVETPSLDDVLQRNIQALIERRREEGKTREERIADVATTHIGSIGFLMVHAAVFGAWALVSIVEFPGIPRFDPTLVLMATFASVEAIFLSTLVLITQNRMSAAADKRAELDLQISLLTEHELTRMLHLVSAVAERLNVRSEVDEEIEELKQDVEVAAVLDKIEGTEGPEADPSKEAAAPRK